jgi:hypothetical protein
MTSQDKYQAFEKLMRRLAQGASGTVAYGTAILAIISLIPGMQLPAALAALGGGIGVNILSNILERMANGEEISDDELFKQLESATEDIRKTLTKEEFFNAYGHLLDKFQDSHMEHKAIIQKIEYIIKAIDLNKIESKTAASRIDVKDNILQVSTGENTRNIQTQVYIENQIIQQARESKKDMQKSKRESLQLSDVKDIRKGIRDSSRIRFLDALDSARFSSQLVQDSSQLLSVLYVKVQFFLAMISGDSIVVTENQLFDSLGFLETFDELYRASEEVGLGTDLPIKVALRETNSNVFQSVANHMGNESFVLALWKDLESNNERRRLWADYIRRGQKPAGEIVLAEEKPLLDKLWAALEYFNPDRCVGADNIPGEFSRRIKRVMKLRDEDLDDLYTGISMDVEQRKYFNTRSEVEAAKEIRGMLLEIQEKADEIKTRSLILSELLNYDNEELKDGVIELTNGIYNQTLGIATRATLIQSSTFPQRVNKYVTAGYSLSTFVQDTSNPFNFYVNWEVFSFDYFKNLEGLDDPRRKDNLILILETARRNVPWKKLIEMQNNSVWQSSLEKFRNNLSTLQTIEKTLSIGSLASTKRKKMENERLNCQKDLKRNWTQHITIVSKLVTSNYWKVTPSEISFNHPKISYSVRISYGFLKTKIDMEGDDGFKIWRNYPSFKGRWDDGAELSEQL